MPRRPARMLGRTSKGNPIWSATTLASSNVEAMPAAGYVMPSSSRMAAKRSRSSAQVDGLGAGAHDGHARLGERVRQLERRLAAQRHHHAVGLLHVHDVHDVLERERLEVQLVGRVVVGGHGFRVAVHHDGLEPGLRQRIGRVHAAVVELDALANAVRACAQDHGTAARLGRHLRLARVVGLVVVGRLAGELGGAGVHGLERGHHVQHLPARAHGELVGAGEVRYLRVGEAVLLEQAERVGVQLVQVHAAQVLLHAHDVRPCAPRRTGRCGSPRPRAPPSSRGAGPRPGRRCDRPSGAPPGLPAPRR